MLPAISWPVAALIYIAGRHRPPSLTQEFNCERIWYRVSRLRRRSAGAIFILTAPYPMYYARGKNISTVESRKPPIGLLTLVAKIVALRAGGRNRYIRMLCVTIDVGQRKVYLCLLPLSHLTQC